MKDISAVESLVVPEGVTVTLKARKITVEGPRGTLTKSVGHIQMDIQLVSCDTGTHECSAMVGSAWHGMA